jgi:tRNA 2-selenouridine synthase
MFGIKNNKIFLFVLEVTVSKTDIVKFLGLSASVPIADVRSPGEYKTGHIPGAVNIPLFDDKQREIVGITYKNEGRIKAILKGLELIGPAIDSRLEKALSHAVDNRLLVYCWRGGMRSETMGWLFSLGGIKTEILEGGYKSYRHHILNSYDRKKKIIVLGGMTGSGKTEILRYLYTGGHQVIDLEDLANHKGSAFGALGQDLQPSSEHFANRLFNEWDRITQDEPVWVEDESRNIGSVFMPDNFYSQLKTAPAIILMIDVENRIPKLLEEYAAFPHDHLRECVTKVSKRLGGENTKKVLTAIESSNMEEAVRIMLRYYDRTYMYSLSRKPSKTIIYVESDTVYDVKHNAELIIEASHKIKI